LRAELESLAAAGELPGSTQFLDSMLHMQPRELGRQVAGAIERLGGTGVIVFGDCSPDMVDRIERPGWRRVPCANCVQLVFGPARYRELMMERAFVLMPEWTRRWKTVFVEELGLDAVSAKEILPGLHSRLVYADTGVEPVPKDDLAACSEWTGLPWSVEAVGLGPLRQALRAMADGLGGEGSHG
jgi:hypothetical protein